MSIFDKKDPRDQHLEIDVIGDRLVISIGLNTLVHAVTHGADFDDEVTITDPDLFVQEVINELEWEEEDGTTLIHRALDTAANKAIDNGCEGVSYEL